MGLDFKGSDVSFSYGGFHRFRRRVASSAGIMLDKMEGYTGTNPIPWSTVNDDLKYLLDHSDCDGQISAICCGKIAKRLEEIIVTWNFPVSDIEANWHLENARTLVKDMKALAKKNKPLIFW